uniref:L1 transposable element RRM domain-containing protein n=1 Tax=Amphiprion percula TaxID=161767 RepID=A0A3P8RTN2_AMPPE
MPPKKKNMQTDSTIKETDVPADADAIANLVTANRRENEESEPEVDVTNNEILKELREYRLEIKTEFAKTNSRLDEAEKRIGGNEEKIQDIEEVMVEMLKTQEQLQEKLTDQECRLRRENIRIYGIPEQNEQSPKTMITFIEKVLRENLSIPATLDLQIQRAHRALGPRPPPGATPRSIVVKFQSYIVKEEVIRLAWLKKGFTLDGHKISLDHDYAPAILVLKENKLRFQTLYPARLRVHYEEGQVTYATVEESTADMASRGLQVKVIKQPATLLERIQRGAWQPVRTKRSTAAGKTEYFRQKLQAFRRTQAEDLG